MLKNTPVRTLKSERKSRLIRTLKSVLACTFVKDTCKFPLRHIYRTLLYLQGHLCIYNVEATAVKTENIFSFTAVVTPLLSPTPASIIKTFHYMGFEMVKPGSPSVPARPELVFMVYTLESSSSSDEE